MMQGGEGNKKNPGTMLMYTEDRMMMIKKKIRWQPVIIIGKLPSLKQLERDLVIHYPMCIQLPRGLFHAHKRERVGNVYIFSISYVIDAERSFSLIPVF